MKTLTFKLNEETEFPQDLIDDAPSQGPFDEYAEYIIENFHIEMSLEDSIKFLKEYGAWDNEELQDLDRNIERVLWLSILDCKENNTNYFYMGA